MSIASYPFLFAQISSVTKGVLPSKALIINTSESWGCLNEQVLKEDVTDGIAKDDCHYATIYEIKNPEDIVNRNELYLTFSANPINGLAGYFVVKFWCDNDKPDIRAYFSMDHARVFKNKNGDWTLLTKAKGNGFVHVKMLYSRTPDLLDVWYSCPQVGEDQPKKTTLFNAYPLEGKFDGVPAKKLGDEWLTLELVLNPIFLGQASSVDKCQEFLEILDKHFSSADRPMVWDRSKIRRETIQSLALKAGADNDEKMFQVLFKANDGTTINVGSDNFLPHFRQKLALENPDGTLIGAELWLRADF